MFISTTVLPKLMKKAYKSRLRVGNMDKGIVIIGAEWMVWIAEERVPNKIKATIMELFGMIPKANEAYTVCKDLPEPQLECIDIMRLNFYDGMHKADRKLIVTPAFINNWKMYRLLQVDKTKEIVKVNDELMGLIDKSELNLDLEGEPTGPACMEDIYSSIYWYNETCKLLILTDGVRTSPLFNKLREVDFSGKEAYTEE